MNPFVAAGSETRTAGGGWQDAWPDALAFVAGLAVAWFADWQTKDLVWSLWLSSLVVGYAMIVWMIFGSGLRAIFTGNGSGVAQGSVMLFGGLFLLAFFTVHFGMFHFVHSVFLQAFFPVTGTERMSVELGTGAYLTILREYWIFLPVAFLAERQAFRLSPAPAGGTEGLKELTGKGGGMMKPYKNVIRLHLLIFFFAFAHFLKLENFLVYAVVYAVYFFPWRLVRRRDAAAGVAGS